eukprot:TRINITY_DN76772_c0_g1_i1.p1 TRINITY_DN76772_c0_g1~~TRINITY_DN76772_c0_g1_i1.p1  ORF type:complete len:162 (+),score=59.44 TRINITY_DN76772_c0_g1_i1:104-589(+)
MDIAIPNDTLTMDVDLSATPLISQGPPVDNKEKALQYFKKHSIAIFLDCVLTELYLEKPSDPIVWFMRFLAKHDVFDDLLQSHKEKMYCKLSSSARDYSVEWKIPFIIEWLLTDMLKDQPTEPDRFALSWFRWNKAAIMARFFDHKIERRRTSTSLSEEQT